MSGGCGQGQSEEDQGPIEPPAPTTTICVRCRGARPPVIHVRVSLYCHQCFHDVFSIELKKGVEPARLRSRNGSEKEKSMLFAEGRKRGNERSSVMLAFSGGAASRALLHAIKSYFPPPPSVPNPKYTAPPAFSSIEVAFVDESGVPGHGPDRTEEVRAIVESEGFSFLPLKLEDVMSSDASTSFVVDSQSPDLFTHAVPSTSSATPLSTLLALLTPHSSTSRHSLHTSLLQSHLRRTAVSRGYSVLLTGETAHRLAIKVLSGMSEGRGYSAGEEVGSYWESEIGGKELMVVRPWCVSTNKQIAYYNKSLELTSLTMEKPGTKLEAKKAGIEALIEEFVTGLEVNFPSTVSTIIRTGGKLGMRSVDAQDRGIPASPCPLCGLPSQIGAQEWRTSITVSSLIEPSSSAESQATPSSSVSLSSLLCYGCLLVFESSRQAMKPIADTSPLVVPPYVGEVAEQRWRGEGEKLIGVRMKSEEEVEKEVSQYLI